MSVFERNLKGLVSRLRTMKQYFQELTRMRLPGKSHTVESKSGKCIVILAVGKGLIM